MITAIIVAAGKSSRFNGENKLLLSFGAVTVLEAAVLPFVNSEDIDDIIVAADTDCIEKYRSILNKYDSVKPIKVVEGGASRTLSVKNALKEVENTFVLIHDGARPNLNAALVKRVIDKTALTGACVPVVPLKESIRNEDGALPREWFFTVQTPQGFDTLKLKFAYEAATGDYNDDAAVYESMFDIADTVEGSADNIKITYPSDYYGMQAKELLIGAGYDAHRLVANRRLILGGEEIPYNKGLEGHSDADALIHAIMDAMLTAVNEGDIGKHFPVDDIKYENISSMVLLKNTLKIIQNKGFNVNNVSATIMAEAPKLASFIPKMSSNISKILNIDISRVGIAATTTEGLGIIGEGKGIASYCVVSLINNRNFH
ncbi:2-C-methyl-D-erythritol 2,4-cyclodiphosphate synthase [bacterium]|nr:2-C-methyl-D-erythritol 2,4-cyclodiphosphate synthase [bacterium]